LNENAALKHTLLRGKALADYQGRYKPEENREGLSTYGTTVHSALSEIVSLVYYQIVISMKKMQLFATFKKILLYGFTATLNF